METTYKARENATDVPRDGESSPLMKPPSEEGKTKEESETNPNPDVLKLEYTEVNNNIRHYSNLRFAIFTVYFAVMSGLIAVAFGFVEMKTGNPEYAKLWARIGGLLATVGFLIFELGCQQYLESYVKTAKEIEEKLHYKQITKRQQRSKPGILTTTYAPLGIYSGLIIFWLAMIVWILIVIGRA